MSQTKFLGVFPVAIEDTPYRDYTTKDWILHFLWKYSQIDGAHHKTWLLDQIARITHGAKVEISQAKWSDNTKEYCFNVSNNCQDYDDWIREYENPDELGNPEYEWDVGIAP